MINMIYNVMQLEERDREKTVFLRGLHFFSGLYIITINKFLTLLTFQLTNDNYFLLTTFFYIIDII